MVRGLCALVLIACGAAFTAVPAAAQDSPTRQAAKPKQAKPAPKKPAPRKKADKKKPAPPAKKPQAKPQARPLPPRAAQSAVPRGSTDTESTITRPGDHAFSIQHGAMTRTYVVHVPPGYSLTAPAPLVVALHGASAGADLQANEAYYGLKAKSDREGFIAVFPQGSGKTATWNAGDCCGAARDQNVDDLGFIRQVVANVFRQMSVERGRIFAAGMSEGGMMAYRLACEVPELFRAVASVAGPDTSRSCNPGSPVSVLHIHAKDDPQRPFAAAAGSRSVPDTATRWAHLNGCAAKPRHILDKAGAYCEAYSYCQGQAAVQLCVTDTGGHSWPGGRAPRASQALSATDLIWDFFAGR